jgi:protein SCO1/2
MRPAALALVAMLWPSLASAGLTVREIGAVALAPPERATAPALLVFKDLQGRSIRLGDAIDGRPTMLLPADFGCKQICGPALSIAATALQQTGLVPGRDYSLVVVGINPQQGIDAARQFASSQVGGPGVSVLSGDGATVDALTAAIGYHFTPDASNDAIAHPAAFVVLTAEGRVSRAMSSLALQPNDLRLALVEAGNGSIGGLAGRIALLCYGFDAVQGIYTRNIAFLLQISGAITVIVIAAAIALLLRRSRKPGASA